MYGYLLLFCIIANVTSYSLYLNVIDEEWETYKVKYNKNYNSAPEDELRRNLFAQSKLRVANHNQKYYEGKESHLIEVNYFSDMLPIEWERYKGLRNKPQSSFQGVSFIGPVDEIQLPKSFDWRDHGAVTSVKDQKNCGSCWAFSAVGALEGQHFRKTGKLVDLSAQNLVDCVLADQGCGGGFPVDAFIYVKNNSGVDTLASYPYEGIDDQCRFNNKTVGATDEGYVLLPKFDEDALLKAVATIGPISVGIDADYSFMNYKEGVYHSNSCSNTDLNHAVLVVGYGTSDKGEDYWLVKNSWGLKWGMNGYIMMSRNKGNNCGIASLGSYPLV